MGHPRLLGRLRDEIVRCTKCPRLVEHRKAVAEDPPKRFRDWDYWARPVPGFGDPDARVLVVGLAPAADGGNRTGRIFTGDRSGDWLFRALHRTGFASRPTSERRDDGLVLDRLYVAAVNRCAPPRNKPTPEERDNCLPYLERELELLEGARAIVALGSFAWEGAIRALRARGHEIPSPKPKFGHGKEAEIGPYVLIGSYHPSQQNTFTGTLTEGMLDQVFERARELAKKGRG